MASNNYAEVITDSSDAQRILAELESMAAQGSDFIVMQFNPDLDQFDSCVGVSNYPTLIDVESCGEPMDGDTALTLWHENTDTIWSIDFGNGFIGLYYESKGRCYIAIADHEHTMARIRRKLDESMTPRARNAEQKPQIRSYIS